MTALSLTFKTMRPLVAAAVVALLALSGPARADDPVRGEVKVLAEKGFLRLLFRLDEAVPAEVRFNFPILVLNFKKPVAVAVDRLNERAPDIISAARIDPDGMAVRIAVAQKVKIHAIPAAERLYIDVMPESWTGVMPGLPVEVIEELANRAREAERKLQKRRLVTRDMKPPTIRVRVATQPTFVRYMFDMPHGANVVAGRHDERLTLNFDQPITWDLGDVLATLPPTLKTVNAKTGQTSAAVNFMLNGEPKVRTFREDSSIAVDVGLDAASDQQAEAAKPAAPAANAGAPSVSPPETVPAENDASMKQAADPPKNMPPPADRAPPRGMAAGKDKHALPHATPPAAPKDKTAGELPKPLPAMKTNEKPAAMQEATHHAASASGPAAHAAAPISKPEPTVAPKPEHKSEHKPEKMAEHAPEPMAPKAEAKPAAAMDGPKQTEAKPTTQENPAAAVKMQPAKPVMPKATTPTPKAKEEAKAKPKSPAADAGARKSAGAPVVAGLHYDGKGLRIEFPFDALTPAAVFRRADMLWLVFDSDARIDLSALMREPEDGIREARFVRGKDGAAVVRLRLARPRLASVVTDGPSWALIIGDRAMVPTKPLTVSRTLVGKERTGIAIRFDKPSAIHRFNAPELGGEVMVITALGPARGFLKPQDFVELRALPSVQGVVLQPLADDITAELSPDKITISRPGGLSLSAVALGQQQLASGFRALTFDTQQWGFNRQAPFNARKSELISEAATAPPVKRRKARMDLARFFLARGMAPEAIGVIDVAMADAQGDDVTGSVLRAVSNVMMDRPDDALKDLSKSRVGNQLDAPVWRAIAYAQQGNWPEAHNLFKDAEVTLSGLPIELQRLALREDLRTAIEVHDFVSADRSLNTLEMLGIPYEMKPSIAVLVGRLDQGLGRNEDALTNYRAAAASSDERAAAQGRLREIMLRFAVGDMSHKDVVDHLDRLTTAWRGDDTEVEGLKLLAHLYTEDKRYRDAFHVMRTAMLAHANSNMTRQIQDEAAATFETLFLDGKGDALPPIEALALFYDYRELTPIGRRGDEMIRKLADRLASVDLLAQAAELLQHQVDHRLHGAARAQVATRLAVIYLMNRKPERALAALRSSRIDGLANELRDERLLLEARALSETGRHELALEMIANIKGHEAIRLRGDIEWAAKHWRQAAEQIERYYGNRWREFEPLTAGERADVLRAAIGYALSDEQIALARFRDKYAAKMADTPDRHAFEVVTAPVGTSDSEFKAVARAVDSVDSLGAFLAEMRKRYPDSAPDAASAAKAKQAAATPEQAKPKTGQAVPVKAEPEKAAREKVKPEKAKPEKAAANSKAGSATPPPKPSAGAPAKSETTGSIPVSLSRLPKPRPIRR
jgi:hypothetical protein